MKPKKWIKPKFVLVSGEKRIFFPEICRIIERDTGVKRKHIKSVILQYLELLKEQLIYYQVNVPRFARFQIVFDSRVNHYVMQAHFDYKYYDTLARERKKSYAVYKQFKSTDVLGGCDKERDLRPDSGLKNDIRNDADIDAKDTDAAPQA